MPYYVVQSVIVFLEVQEISITSHPPYSKARLTVHTSDQSLMIEITEFCWLLPKEQRISHKDIWYASWKNLILLRFGGVYFKHILCNKSQKKYISDIKKKRISSHLISNTFICCYFFYFSPVIRVDKNTEQVVRKTERIPWKNRLKYEKLAENTEQFMELFKKLCRYVRIFYYTLWKILLNL